MNELQEAVDWIAAHNGEISITCKGNRVWVVFRVDPTLKHPDANGLAHKTINYPTDIGEAICQCLSDIRHMLKERGIPDDRLVPVEVDVKRMGAMS